MKRSMFKKILMILIRVMVLSGMAGFAFYSGIEYQKSTRYLHPRYGTVICKPGICKKELGPVFYFKKQCEVVINAMDELDKQKRKCVKMIK